MQFQSIVRCAIPYEISSPAVISMLFARGVHATRTAIRLAFPKPQTPARSQKVLP